MQRGWPTRPVRSKRAHDARDAWRRPHFCDVADSADRASWIVTTKTWSVSSSYAYTSSIQDHGPRMKRNPCQRPVSGGPSNGNVVSGPSEDLTRSRVVVGRLWVVVRRSRSATAVSVRTTAATGLQVLEPDTLTQTGFAEPLLCSLVGVRDRPGRVPWTGATERSCQG